MDADVSTRCSLNKLQNCSWCVFQNEYPPLVLRTIRRLRRQSASQPGCFAALSASLTYGTYLLHLVLYTLTKGFEGGFSLFQTPGGVISAPVMWQCIRVSLECFNT